MDTKRFAKDRRVRRGDEVVVNTIIQGNILDVAPTLPEVDMVMTSPPYWGLRDYSTEPQAWGDGDCEHEWGEKIPKGGRNKRPEDQDPKFAKGLNPYENSKDSNFCIHCNAWKGELGLEPTPELYIEHLCDIFDSLPIKKTGSLWVNIADSYSGSGCGTNDCRTEGSKSIQGVGKNKGLYKTGGITRGITDTVPAKSLVGIPEMFVLEMKRRGWLRRNTIIWHKPSCMPSSAKDRFTVDFEYLYFFTKQGKYYFEQQLEPYTESLDRWGGDKLVAKGSSQWDKGTGQTLYRDREMRPNPEGRNKRCVWSINPQPSPDEHYAMYLEKLCITPIKAGCPKDGVVLDPFLGGGTSAVVAHKLGRNWIGVELNPKSIKIAKDRIEEKMRQRNLF